MSQRISIDTRSGDTPILVRPGGDSPRSSTSTTWSEETGSTAPVNISAEVGNVKGERTAVTENGMVVSGEKLERIEEEYAHFAAKRAEAESTIVEGISDSDLWAMLRMFNNQINHIQSPARNIPPNEPDLRRVVLADAPYRSDTFKSNFQRVVTVVAPTSMMGIRELMRLSDWDNEFVRTASYCASYFTAWWYGHTLIVCALFGAVLICFPNTRRYLFPPPPPPEEAPPELEDLPLNGHDKNHGKGKIHHRTKVEWAEHQALEAGAILTGFTQTLFLGGDRAWRFRKNSSVGESKNQLPALQELDEDPIIRDEKGNEIGRRFDMDELEANDVAADALIGGQGLIVHDDDEVKKAQKQEAKRQRDKRDIVVAKLAKAAETTLGTLADIFEMLQNAFSPPAAYPDHQARFKIAAAVFIIPALVLHIIPARVFGRFITFFIGVAIWWTRSFIRWLKQIEIPDWLLVALDPRNNLLSGTPTQAQLVLYLLREAEREDDPLPPPPTMPPDSAAKVAVQDSTVTEEMSAQDEQYIESATSAPEGAVKKAAVKGKRKLARVLQKVSRKAAGVHGDVAVDGKTKKISWLHESQLSRRFGGDSPDAYACKLNNTSGHIIVDGSECRVAFIGVKSATPEYIWDVDDIVELKKDSVSLPRMVAGWIGGAHIGSLGLTVRFVNRADHGIDWHDKVADEQDGDLYHFEKVDRRDALFNRLVALGSQRWEMM